MEEKSGVVSTDPLFLGLTRPPMIFGVSFRFFFLNFFVSVITYINAPGLKVLAVALLMHLLGYIICFKEPLFLEIYIKRAEKCGSTSNGRLHGGNSYDQF